MYPAGAISSLQSQRLKEGNNRLQSYGGPSICRSTVHPSPATAVQEFWNGSNNLAPARRSPDDPRDAAGSPDVRPRNKAAQGKPSATERLCQGSPKGSRSDASIACAQPSTCERSRAVAATLTKSARRPLAVRHDTQNCREHCTYDKTHRWMAPNAAAPNAPPSVSG